MIIPSMISEILDSVPASMAAWLACLAFIVLLINELAKLRRNLFPAEKSEPRSISPQPLEVRESAPPVRERDCLVRHSLVDKRLDAHSIAQRGDAADLHQKINTVALKVSEMAGKQDLQNQRLSEINAKLDRVAERQIDAAKGIVDAAVQAAVQATRGQ